RQELAEAIAQTQFQTPQAPIYQNINARASVDIEQIKQNLIDQLTGAVRWTQTIQNMLRDGASSFTEVGPGNVLQGLVKKWIVKPKPAPLAKG
ncbi:MAG: ACP S-malonyltransferase, partial [Bacteroidia bacterium]|nr:ACP S-malonyltransferase [Bacteroidia bacterium]